MTAPIQMKCDECGTISASKYWKGTHDQQDLSCPDYTLCDDCYFKEEHK